MSATPGRIDVTFDLRTDAGGKDPDSHSPTLREYHRLLWSKELPSGRRIEFDTHTRGAYLHHDSDLGQVVLSSDIIVVSLSYLRQMAALEKEIRPSLLNRFARSYRTIGGYLVFPANRIGGKMTINGAKGFHPRIKDRSDLTLECIRRHYAGVDSPLTEPLARYADFFALFGDFAGYVDFFLLQDAVNPDGSVIFYTPFADFTTSPLPTSVSEYRDYLQACMTFVAARGNRIAVWATQHGLA